MKTILALLLSLTLISPLWSAPNHPGHRGDRHEARGHFRGNHGSFRRGLFFGETIVLDDGCYFWDGSQWVLSDNCD